MYVYSLLWINKKSHHLIYRWCQRHTYELRRWCRFLKKGKKYETGKVSFSIVLHAYGFSILASVEVFCSHNDRKSNAEPIESPYGSMFAINIFFSHFFNPVSFDSMHTLQIGVPLFSLLVSNSIRNTCNIFALHIFPPQSQPGRLTNHK